MLSTGIALAILGLILPFQGQFVSALPLSPLSTTSTSTRVTNLDTLPLLSLTKRLQQVTETTPLLHALHTTHHLPRQLTRRADTFPSGTVATALFVALIVVAVLIGAAIGSIAICGLDWKYYLKRREARKDLGEIVEGGVSSSEKAEVERVEKDVIGKNSEVVKVEEVGESKGKNPETVKVDEVKESKGWLKKAVYR